AGSPRTRRAHRIDRCEPHGHVRVPPHRLAGRRQKRTSGPAGGEEARGPPPPLHLWPEGGRHSLPQSRPGSRQDRTASGRPSFRRSLRDHRRPAPARGGPGGWPMTSHDERTCPICGQTWKPSHLVPAEMVRGGISDLIRRDHPGWGGAGDIICRHDLNHYRSRFVEELIAEEGRELTSIEQDVVEKLRTQELVSVDTNLELDQRVTFGDRLSDRVARFGGSWAFILSFGAFLLIWMVINTIALFRRPFDPYPFILLNLILSSIAALQAPII